MDALDEIFAKAREIASMADRYAYNWEDTLAKTIAVALLAERRARADEIIAMLAKWCKPSEARTLYLTFDGTHAEGDIVELTAALLAERRAGAEDAARWHDEQAAGMAALGNDADAREAAALHRSYAARIRTLPPPGDAL
jgi:hypothetical protein